MTTPSLGAIQPGADELALFRLRAQAKIKELQLAGKWDGGLTPHVEYQKKPVEWIVEKLGVPEHTIRWSLSDPELYAKHVWDGDKDPLVLALEAVSRGESVAISSGTNTGKTYAIGACLVLWFLAVFPRSIVLSIAPREDQLLLNLWKELGKQWSRFVRHFPTAVLQGGKLRMLPGAEEREIWTATATTAGVGADEQVAQHLAGFHHPEMLWLIEETPGVDQAIMNTIINTATGRFNPIVAMGNRDHQHDTLGLFSARSWVTSIRISAYDHPNVVTGRNIIDGAVTPQSIERRLADVDGNTNDPIFMSRVRGIAPMQSARAMIAREWCEAAAKRWSDPELRKGPPALGVDVADSPTGDLSCISRWQGACCTEVSPFRAADASEVGRIVFGEITNADNPINPKHVGIDAIGVGASTVNELKRLGARIKVISGATRPVPKLDTEAMWETTEDTDHGTQRPTGPRIVEAERYSSHRSQVLWRLREDLRLHRIALPNDPKLFEELTAIEYEEPGGKITVALKEKIRQRLGRSPDRADAVAYGNWARPRIPVRTVGIVGIPQTTTTRDTGLERMLARQAKQSKKEEQRIRRLFEARAKNRRRP